MSQNYSILDLGKELKSARYKNIYLKKIENMQY